MRPKICTHLQVTKLSRPESTVIATQVDLSSDMADMQTPKVPPMDIMIKLQRKDSTKEVVSSDQANTAN